MNWQPPYMAKKLDSPPIVGVVLWECLGPLIPKIKRRHRIIIPAKSWYQARETATRQFNRIYSMVVEKGDIKCVQVES